MKGIITDIKRLAVHDGDGIRTTVFFKGCSLKCVWCHNPENIAFEPQIAFYKHKCIDCGACKKRDFLTKNCPTQAKVLYGKEITIEKIMPLLLEDKDFYDNSGGGITLSGGECLCYADFCANLLKKCKENGLNTMVDTCGFVSKETFDKVIPYTDKFLYDIKAINPEVHKKCTGHTNELILSNLKYLCDKGCKIEIRYPLVMGYNDGECKKIGEYLKGLTGITKIKVLQYHNYSGSKYAALGMKNTLPKTETTYDDVENAVNKLKRYGLNAINGIDGD